jgi:hypothetical protein
VSLEVQSGKTKVLPIWHEIDKQALFQKIAYARWPSRGKIE